jgi:hypothetical protein
MASEPSHIPAALASLVRQRAGELCEYCRLPQSSQEATFHIDHISPRWAGGLTKEDNLALACVSCSLRKSARTKARDPLRGKVVPLFHPRIHRWIDHFAWKPSWLIEGKTPIGRATIAALKMNRATIVAIRQLLAESRRFPPSRRAPK